MFGKYSKYSSTFFFKKNKHKLIKNRSDIKIHTINFGNKGLSDKYDFNFNFIVVLLSKIIDNIFLFFKILKKVNPHKIKYVHVHNINLLLCAYFLNIMFKKQIILSIGGSDIYNLAKKNLFKILINKVSLVLSVSSDLKKKFNKIYPATPCEIMGNGVDLNFYNFKKIKKNKIISAVGNIRWQKDYLTLVKAFNQFVKKNTEYKLLICGNIYDQEEYHKILKFIKKNSIESKVVFKGFLKPNQIKKIIYRSKILIISSVSEGLPKILLESISCGTPVISTDVGDNLQILENKKLIVPKKNSKRMYMAMNSLIKSKKIYNEVINNFYKKRINYNWKKLVEETEKKIEKIIC